MTPVTTYLTPAEAATWLCSAGVSVSEDTVRRWAKGGRLPAVRLPFGRMRIRQEDLEALIAPTAGAA